VSISGVPAREDAVPSNLQYRSKLGSRGATYRDNGATLPPTTWFVVQRLSKWFRPVSRACVREGGKLLGLGAAPAKTALTDPSGQEPGNNVVNLHPGQRTGPRVVGIGATGERVTEVRSCWPPQRLHPAGVASLPATQGLAREPAFLKVPPGFGAGLHLPAPAFGASPPGAVETLASVRSSWCGSAAGGATPSLSDRNAGAEASAAVSAGTAEIGSRQSSIRAPAVRSRVGSTSCWPPSPYPHMRHSAINGPPTGQRQR